MLDSQAFAVQSGTSQFFCIVVAAIVETQGDGNALTVFVEHGGGIESAGINENSIFGGHKT